MSHKPRSLCPLLRECLAVSNMDGQAFAYDLLTSHGYTVHCGQGGRYCYGPGTAPVLLVAHTDTVHEAPPSALYHDRQQRILWSPDGLGADDRAGVYAIARILRDCPDIRPHVLLTDCEETGGQGAEDASADLFTDPPEVNVMIQLDRQGARDAVTYSCDCPPLLRYLKPYGYRHAQGSFSDISVLMPDWQLAGVNLSVGYYRQHSAAEHLRLNELEYTIGAVADMVARPPARRLVYRQKKQSLHVSKGYCLIDRSHQSLLSEYDRQQRKADLDRELDEWLARENALDNDDTTLEDV